MAKQVINTTQNTVVCNPVKLANNVVTRFFGLMGKTSMPQGFGLWIVPCNSIHSFFMRMGFDAVFIDKQGKVLHLIERMKPWGMSPFVKGAKAVLELNPGAIAQTGVQVGDVLQIVEQT